MAFRVSHARSIDPFMVAAWRFQRCLRALLTFLTFDAIKFYPYACLGNRNIL